MKIKKYMAMFLAFTMCVSATGCGNTKKTDDVNSSASSENDTESNTDDVKESIVKENFQNIKYPEMGIDFSVPIKWDTDENVNILIENLTVPNSDIYSFLEYSYAPDANMEEINDPESMISIYDLSAPIFLFFVVKDENLNSPVVQNSMKLYDKVHELGKEGVYNFYFMTDYNDLGEIFTDEDKAKYEEMKKETYEILDTITVNRPDENSVLARLQEGQKYLVFDSETLYGTPMNNWDFASKDVTVLNFYGTYAYPDINEFSELEKLNQEIRKNYPNVNFMQVIIDTPDSQAEDDARDIYKKEDVTFEGIIPDENLANWCVEHLVGLPTTIFVDNEGRIHNTVVEGKNTAETYLQKLDYVLSDVLDEENLDEEDLVEEAEAEEE